MNHHHCTLVPDPPHQPWNPPTFAVAVLASATVLDHGEQVDVPDVAAFRVNYWIRTPRVLCCFAAAAWPPTVVSDKRASSPPLHQSSFYPPTSTSTSTHSIHHHPSINHPFPSPRSRYASPSHRSPAPLPPAPPNCTLLPLLSLARQPYRSSSTIPTATWNRPRIVHRTDCRTPAGSASLFLDRALAADYLLASQPPASRARAS
jgi:hypothetical protein